MTATVQTDPQAIYDELMATEPPHALLALPSMEQMVRILEFRDGEQRLRTILDLRRELVTEAARDPLRSEPEPEHWQKADEVTERVATNGKWRIGQDGTAIFWLILLGGNRSGKSRYCAKRVMQDACSHPNGLVLCLSEDETTSRETQQQCIWHYMPAEWKTLRDKKDRGGVYRINWSEAGGFTERLCVLPNRTKIYFKTYNQDPGEVEGWEFGHASDRVVGVWADENLRLNWMRMMERRIQFRPALVLWSFTPIRGMTPTIKEAVGAARTVESRPALLLSDRVNVPGLPRGHMPYVQIAQMPRARVLYFHSELSPFGPGPGGTGRRYFEAVKELCDGKPSKYVQCVAYGYTEDVVGRAFPKFGSVNVVPHDQLPAEGTNYMFTDPAGDRNWATIWVRVAPGKPRRLFIYRDWPDAQRYGEWAVPTERAVTSESTKGWDGEPGPGQRSLGYGVARYKQLFLEEERIREGKDYDGQWKERDPYRVKLLWQMTEDGRRRSEDEEIREEVRERFVDPRAGANPTAAEKGGTNILQMFHEEQRHTDGTVVGPRMALYPAYTGKGIDDGLNHVNDLLDYDETEPVCPLINEPHLYVSERCLQVRWMFINYTGRGGEHGACKDYADLVRYMAQTDLLHVTPEMRRWREGGSY